MIILIADDDKLIRFTMKSMLHDILDTQTNYLEASNGLELVELCKKNIPDIAFVDIKMPYMDGISAIEQCRQFSPDTEFVIISGYTDFEYAKRCIPLQITEYLVKPVEEEQLSHIITLLCKKLNHRKHKSNSDFRLFLLNSFNYLSAIGDSPEFEEPPIFPEDSYYMFGIFTSFKKGKHSTYPPSIQQLLYDMNELGQIYIQKNYRYSMIYSNDGTPYFVFQLPTNQALLQNLIHSMERIFRSYKDDSVNCTIIYCKDTSCRGLFNQMDYLDSHSYFSMGIPNHTIFSVCDFAYSQMQISIFSLLDTLLHAYQYADKIVYKDTINTLYRMHMYDSQYLDLTIPAQYIKRLTGYPVHHLTFKEFCRSLIDMSETMYTQVARTDLTQMEQIKQYINKNYMNDISISQIAELFNLTPNYLSSLFHQQEACKLIDYITEVRLNHAKRILIENVTASIKDIAVMVGYTSARHFSTIFQKSTGITPSSYRKTPTTSVEPL